MVRHIRRGYDGTDENPLLMRWTIPAALMYCITIYTTIGNNVNPFFSFYYKIMEHIFLSCCRLIFSAGQTNEATFIISAKTMSSSRK